GLVRCRKCTNKYLSVKKILANEYKSIATTDQEFVKLFWNEEDAFKYSRYSMKKVDFKCHDCGSKVKKKAINNVYRNNKVYCSCNDNLPYPEKFMRCLLTQLNVDFETEKTFNWSKNLYSSNQFLNGTKIYDF